MVKTGTKKFKVNQGKVTLQSTDPFSVNINGQYAAMSTDNQLTIKLREPDTEVEIVTTPKAQWTYDYSPRKTGETPDPVPFEIPDDLKTPETLSTKIERLVMATLTEKYGKGQVETFAESMDFDIDDDGELPISRHEIIDMPEDVLTFPDETPTPTPTPTPDPTPAPTPAEPLTEPPAEPSP